MTTAPVSKWARVWFIQRPGVIAKVKRTFHVCQWDHVTLELNDSIWDIHPTVGVMRRRADELGELYPNATYTLVRVYDVAAAEAFLRAQLSKPGTPKVQRLGTPLTREHWHPAALVAEALIAGRSTVSWPTWRAITPYVLWECLPKLVMSPTSS